MTMLIVTLGVVLTAVVVAKAGRRATLRPADLGSMSHQWVAGHNASRQESSL